MAHPLHDAGAGNHPLYMTETTVARTPPRVVIVDDDEDIRSVVYMLLDDDGFRATAYATPEQAIAALGVEGAALLITDKRLGGGDGFELIRYVARHPGLVGRVLLLTAARLRQDSEDAALLQATGTSIVSKPFDIDYLLDIVRALTDWPGAS